MATSVFLQLLPLSRSDQLTVCDETKGSSRFLPAFYEIPKFPNSVDLRWNGGSHKNQRDESKAVDPCSHISLPTQNPTPKKSHIHIYTQLAYTDTHNTLKKHPLTSMHSHAHTNNKQTLRDDRESQTEKDNYHMTSLICGVQKIHKNLFTKQKQTHRYRKETYGYHLGEWCGR